MQYSAEAFCYLLYVNHLFPSGREKNKVLFSQYLMRSCNYRIVLSSTYTVSHRWYSTFLVHYSTNSTSAIVNKTKYYHFNILPGYQLCVLKEVIITLFKVKINV